MATWSPDHQPGRALAKQGSCRSVRASSEPSELLCRSSPTPHDLRAWASTSTSLLQRGWHPHEALQLGWRQVTAACHCRLTDT